MVEPIDATTAERTVDHLTAAERATVGQKARNKHVTASPAA